MSCELELGRKDGRFNYVVSSEHHDGVQIISSYTDTGHSPLAISRLASGNLLLAQCDRRRQHGAQSFAVQRESPTRTESPMHRAQCTRAGSPLSVGRRLELALAG